MKNSKKIMTCIFIAFFASCANGMMMQYSQQEEQKEQSEPMVSLPQVIEKPVVLPKRTILDAVFPKSLVNGIAGGKHNPLKEFVIPSMDIGQEFVRKAFVELIQALPVKRTFSGTYSKLSPNNELIYIEAPNSRKVFNIETGEVVFERVVNSRHILEHASFSADSGLLLLDFDEECLIYDLTSKKEIYIEGTVSFWGDTRYIHCQCYEKERLYDVQSNTLLFSGDRIFLDPSGKYVAVESSNKITVYDFLLREEKMVIDVSDNYRGLIEFQAHFVGRFLAIDNIACPRLYDIEKKLKVEIFDSDENYFVHDEGSFVYDNAKNYIGLGMRGMTHIWDTKTGLLLRKFNGDDSCFSYDGSLIMCDGQIYDVKSGAPLEGSKIFVDKPKQLLDVEDEKLYGAPHIHGYINISADQSLLSRNDGVICLFDISPVRDLIKGKITPQQAVFLMLLDDHYTQELNLRNASNWKLRYNNQAKKPNVDRLEKQETISLLDIARKNKISLKSLQDTLHSFDPFIEQAMIEKFHIDDPTVEKALLNKKIREVVAKLKDVAAQHNHNHQVGLRWLATKASTFKKAIIG